MRSMISAPGALALTVTAALGLAGCGGKGEDPGNTLGNLFAYNSTKAPPVAATGQSTVAVECPIIVVADSGSAYRIYAGADKSNTGVRTQYSLGELSRDCSSDGTTVNIRIGISGFVQAGPAGGPGSFLVPVKVLIQRESDKQPAVVKTYRINASIPQGETEAPFAMVTEPIPVPFVSKQADEDYSIYVGFDQGGAAAPRTVARRHRRR